MTMSRNQAQPQAMAKAHKLQASLPLPLPMMLLLLMLLLVVPPQPCESRYMQTRSHGDDLDKLRELMHEILELGNEDPQQLQEIQPSQQQQQQQQQQLPQLPHQMRLRNEGNNPLTAQRAGSSNAAWLQKLGVMGALDTDAGYGRY